MRTKLGAIYHIEFEDHSQGSLETAKSHLVGKLIKRDRKLLVFCVWWYANAEYRSQDDVYALDRRAVDRMTELKEIDNAK